MNRPLSLAIALAVVLAAPAARAQSAKKDGGKPLFAVFETSKGKIGIRLLPDEAPKTVKNFVELARGEKAYQDPATHETKKAPYFDGTLFHRVIPGFMIQGGDPNTRNAPPGATSANGMPFGTQGPGYEFEDELPAPGTKLFSKPCALAMANHGPNTNGSQFFITEGAGSAVPQLEPRACDAKGGVCGYTRFGEGVCGCDLVGQIARAGNSQVRLVKVTVTSETPTCK